MNTHSIALFCGDTPNTEAVMQSKLQETNSSVAKGSEIDLATRLLRSSDSKVAAAAKRIFSRPEYEYPIHSSHATMEVGNDDCGTMGSELIPPAFIPNNVIASNVPILCSGEGHISADIREAAPAVARFAPQHQHSPNDALVPIYATPSSVVSLIADRPAAASLMTISETTSSGRIDCKKQLPADRLLRSRERNRVHARKTRQRKKEQMAILQSRANELKTEQLRLKQVINDKNTANILVGMFSTKSVMLGNTTTDPKIDELLKRSVEDIPDASKIPELPALILPGQHSSKRKSRFRGDYGPENSDFDGPIPLHEQVLNDGIDYALLGKDRSKCTPTELDKIRRERNRMHAKRTRDRKRIFTEEMEEMIRQLEEENTLLQNHVEDLGAGHVSLTDSNATPALMSPASIHPFTDTIGPIFDHGSSLGETLLSLTKSNVSADAAKLNEYSGRIAMDVTSINTTNVKGSSSETISPIAQKSLIQKASLLTSSEAPGKPTQIGCRLAMSSVASAVSASTSQSGQGSFCGDDDVYATSDESALHRKRKRRCLHSSYDFTPNLPIFITTKPSATIGC